MAASRDGRHGLGALRFRRKVEVAWQMGNSLGLQFLEVPARISSIFAGLLPEDCLAAA